MAKLEISTKRLAISKANAQMAISLSVASFIVTFSLVAAHALLGQEKYQAKVIHAKNTAANQLKTNVGTVNALNDQYTKFVNKPGNIIGGSTSGTGDNDGDNAKIVLDALPSQYDFPALISSLEKLLTQRNFKISSIAGSDDQIAQQTNQDSPTPKAVAMPFTFTVKDANFSSVKDLMDVLQRSIRPIVVDSLAITGGENSMQLTVNAHSFYQPEKDLKIRTQVVK